MLDKLKSRKLWAMIIAAVLGVFNEQIFHIPPTVFGWVIGALIAYIGGESAVDIARAHNPKPPVA